MRRKETYKFFIKTILDRENETYQSFVKVRGDYFESLMFAVEAVAESLICELGMSKKDFLKAMENLYDIKKKEIEESECEE